MKTYAVVIGAETSEVERLRAMLAAPELRAAALVELNPPPPQLTLVPPFKVQGDGRVVKMYSGPDLATFVRDVRVTWVMEVLEVRGDWWRVSNHPLWMQAMGVKA